MIDLEAITHDVYIERYGKQYRSPAVRTMLKAEIQATLRVALPLLLKAHAEPVAINCTILKGNEDLDQYL